MLPNNAKVFLFVKGHCSLCFNLNMMKLLLWIHSCERRLQKQTCNIYINLFIIILRILTHACRDACINAGWPVLSNIAINFARLSEFLCYLVTDGCWFTQARFHQFEHARMWEGKKLHFWTRYVLLLCVRLHLHRDLYMKLFFSIIKLWITYFLINRWPAIQWREGRIRGLRFVQEQK